MALTPLINETEVLAKIATGDQRAFTILFNHYHRDILSFSIKLTKSEELALEIVQDVFLKVWSFRAKLVEIESFGGYLSRMVRNHCLNALRDLERKKRLGVQMDIDASEFSQTLGYDPIHQQLDYKSAMHMLNDALDHLAPQQRQVYQLCHLDGLKYEEAALAMGISKETVRGHMKKALAIIREHFRKNAIYYPLLIIALSK
ncbi:RNA polymerase sigma-70 factor [Pedobacter sp. Du54]|uniref:RNA polymerase sigma factor n=1 Tax=Pedobacter anseongensis TaxID=3133439 RepID=UPI0030A3B5EB